MSENQKYIFIGLSVAFVFFLGFWLGKVVFSREGVSGFGDAASNVTVQLRETENQQSKITTGIKESKEIVRDIRDRVNSSKESIGELNNSNGKIGNYVEESGRLIEENQRILRQIQERGCIETK